MRATRIVRKILPKWLSTSLLSTTILYFLWSLFSNFVESRNKTSTPIGASRSFSQTGEDIACEIFLPEQFGMYIDVGCGQPVHGSNTYLFYKKGWNGVVVDPILNNQKLFKVLRSRDVFRRVLIGPVGQSTMFYEMIPYVYSTTNIDFANRWVEEGRKIKSKVELKFESLMDFAPKTGPLSPSLLSIDVEGQEMDCLESINFDFYSPRVICIEEWEETIVDGFSKIRVKLTSRNYSLVARTELSSIFVHNAYLSLRPELLA